MRLHSSMLAGGMIVVAIFACNTSNNSNSNNNGSNRPANAEVYVDQIHMAKDEDGKAGASTTSYSPSEHRVYVVMTLNKAKADTKIRVVWIAQDVQGSKNSEIKSFDYTTNALDKTLPFYLTWPQDWPRGAYKVEVYINGVLDKTINYNVD
jgi:hypothetical protein